MIHFRRFDHFLTCIPPGTTEQARAFYRDVMGLVEIPGEHPKGAIWFQLGDIQIHLREEVAGCLSDRHPAFEISDLEGAKAHFRQHQVSIALSSDIDGRDRFFIRDPFGNRMEFLEYLEK